MSKTKKTIQIIVPVFNEAGNLPRLFEALQDVFSGLAQYDWRVCFVDDGSSDDSVDVINALAQKHARVEGLILSRNFGKELALTAGVENVQDCDALICMDADLQHPPEIIPEFIREWEAGYEIIVGQRDASCNPGVGVKALGSKLFYSIMTRFSEIDIEPNTTDFRLLDAKVIDTLRRFTERTRMFRGLIDWTGYRKKFLMFTAPARCEGDPGYSLKKLFNLALNSFTSFSLVPLRLMGLCGFLVTVLTLFVLGYMVVTDIYFGQLYRPIAYFMVFNTLMVGIVLGALGLIALYIGHIHIEVVQRPLYIIRKRILSPQHRDSHDDQCGS